MRGITRSSFNTISARRYGRKEDTISSFEHYILGGPGATPPSCKIDVKESLMNMRHMFILVQHPGLNRNLRNLLRVYRSPHGTPCKSRLLFQFVMILSLVRGSPVFLWMTPVSSVFALSSV